MASSSNLHQPQLSFDDMLTRLEDMAKPVINDERQQKYCEYITMFLSYFGKERCQVTGSTIDQTRLRLSKNEGDFDYLVISEITIPIECVEYRGDIPSFVHIDGRSLQNIFPTIKLIEDKYLPSSLLRDIQPTAFKHLRDIYQIVKRFSSVRGRHTLSVAFSHKTKLGICLQSYKDMICEEISSIYKKPQRDDTKIRESLKEYFKDKPSEFSDGVISSIRTVGSLINEYDKVDGTSESPSTFQQTFGGLISAVGDEEDIRLTAGNMSPELKRPKITPVEDIPHTTFNPKDVICSLNEDVSHSSNENDATKYTLDVIKIQYKEKSSKDFIPCFPLSGKPKHMIPWKIRKRVSNWPPQEVIDDIYDSEFFIVAKPAIHQPETEKDFCLAYNIPERKLAKAMTRVQKDVLLIIKAIHKSFLGEYSDEITTFHWKTALYWESECVEPAMLQERSEVNILSFLTKVLERMTNSLCDGELIHYFNSTNLFAGKDTGFMQNVIQKIVQMQEDPIGVLRLFFIEQDDGKCKEELIPRERIIEFLNYENDQGDHSLVAETLALLYAFSKENKDTLRKALTDVLTYALPYIIEENTRGKKKDKYDPNSDMIQKALIMLVDKESLIEGCVSLLLDNIDNQKMSAEEIVQQFYALVLQQVVGNLFGNILCQNAGPSSS